MVLDITDVVILGGALSNLVVNIGHNSENSSGGNRNTVHDASG